MLVFCPQSILWSTPCCWMRMTSLMKTQVWNKYFLMICTAGKLLVFFSTDFQLGIGVYPGENLCNPSSNSPHAKWHLETGIGLVDWGHLADLYFQVFPQKHFPAYLHTCILHTFFKKNSSFQILPQAEDSAQLHFYWKYFDCLHFRCTNYDISNNYYN